MPGVGLASRVVAVTADRGPGAPPGRRYSFGSGCLIGSGAVLTAAHVVAGAKTVTVRTADWTEHPAQVDPAFVGDPAGWDPDRPAPPDLALLTLTDPVEVPRMRLARLDRDHPAGLIERAASLGYPWFSETGTPAGETVRVQAPAAGTVLLSRREDGLLDFQVTIAPTRPEGVGVGSAWAGMSGAPVTASGRLIGVVTEHAPRKGPSSVAVIPLTALNPDPAHASWGAGVGDPAAWWARLGVQDGTDLTVLPQRREAPYRASLREFGDALHARMPELLGREAWLADIAAFATGDQPYLWLVGGAFAGKSALVYEAVTTGVLPDTVDVVVYFLYRRDTDASADRFLEVVVPQLEVLLGWEEQTRDRDRFNQAWQEAAANARRDGRHLLLVVDALDEDLHPPGAPWVSDLLPSIVGPNAPVLVTSRPHPQIRDHVPTTHPLKTCPQIPVEPFEGAADLADQAKDEIDDLADGDDIDVDVLGLLTVAAGAMSMTDLATLHKPEESSAAVRRKIRTLLTERAARSLEPVGSHDAPRYRFAHDLLAEHARANPNLADPSFRNKVHTWAHTWAQAGWPDPGPDGSGTPRYLLDTYPTTLLGDPAHPNLLPPEPDRLAALVGDVRWVDAAIRTVGVDPVLTVLGRAAAGGDRHVADLHAVVAKQAVYFRPPHPVDQPGHVLRHLCLQALQYGMSDLAGDLRGHLSGRPGELLPVWTSSTPPTLDLGTHDDEVAAVAALPDGRVVTGGNDRRVRLWDPDQPGTPVELGTHDDGVSAVAVLPDGRVVTGGGDRRVLLWDPDRPGTPLEPGTHDDWVRAAAALPDERVVTGGTDRRVRLWDPDRPGTPLELGTHDDSVAAVAVLPDGRVVTGGDDRRVLLWDPDRPGTSVLEINAEGSLLAASSHTARPDLLTVAGAGVTLWQIADTAAAPGAPGSPPPRSDGSGPRPRTF